MRSHPSIIEKDNISTKSMKKIRKSMNVFLNCTKCDQVFENRALLLKHLEKIHINEKLYICNANKCNAFYDTEQLLKEHVKIHQITCKRCLLQCKDNEDLIQHFKTHENDPMPYMCYECGKGFVGSAGLDKHRRVC